MMDPYYNIDDNPYRDSESEREIRRLEWRCAALEWGIRILLFIIGVLIGMSW